MASSAASLKAASEIASASPASEIGRIEIWCFRSPNPFFVRSVMAFSPSVAWSVLERPSIGFFCFGSQPSVLTSEERWALFCRT